MIITLLNQKGGVGKTTITLLLGGILKHAGYNVAIDDRDPQGSARFFSEAFDVPMIRDAPEAEYILTDTPGHLRIEGTVEQELTELVVRSDTIILVTEKSPASIHGSLPMARLINARKRDTAKAFVLFNRIRSVTAIGKQDGADIAQDLGLKPLGNELPLTAAYENAFVHGLNGITGKHREQLLNLALEIMK